MAAHCAAWHKVLGPGIDDGVRQRLAGGARDGSRDDAEGRQGNFNICPILAGLQFEGNSLILIRAGAKPSGIKSRMAGLQGVGSRGGFEKKLSLVIGRRRGGEIIGCVEVQNDGGPGEWSSGLQVCDYAGCRGASGALRC